jgi:hypothetical protein
LLYCFIALGAIGIGYFCTFYLVTTGATHRSENDKRSADNAPPAGVPVRRPKESASNDWGSFFATSLPPFAHTAMGNARQNGRDGGVASGSTPTDWMQDVSTHPGSPRMHNQESNTVLEGLEMQHLESDPVQGANLVDVLGQIDRYGR